MDQNQSRLTKADLITKLEDFKPSSEDDRDRKRLNEILKSIGELNKGLQDFIDSLPNKTEIPDQQKT